MPSIDGDARRLEHHIYFAAGDLEELGKIIEKIGSISCLVIDPITAFMGKIDSHRTTDVRAVLAPLTEFAEAHNVAVFAITHPPKASQAKAIHAFTGSLAHVAAPRMTFLVVEEEGTDRVLFLHAKNNLAPPPAGLAFRKTQGPTAGGIIQSYIIWDTAPVTVTAGEALHASSGRDGSALADAKEFLCDCLASGPVAQEVVKAAAEREGISSATLRRAKTALRVASQVKSEKCWIIGSEAWPLRLLFRVRWLPRIPHRVPV